MLNRPSAGEPRCLRPSTASCAASAVLPKPTNAPRSSVLPGIEPNGLLHKHGHGAVPRPPAPRPQKPVLGPLELAAAGPAPAPAPANGRRKPCHSAGCSRCFIVLIVIVAALHCSLVSGLGPWLLGDQPMPGWVATLFSQRHSRLPAGRSTSAGAARSSRIGGSSRAATDSSGWVQQSPPLPPLEGQGAFPEAPSWEQILQIIRESERLWLVVEVKNGLGNRLRALASAMAVPPSPLAPHGPALTPSARSLAPPRGRQSLPPHRPLRSAVASQVSRAEERPLLALWEPDLHCNCSLRTLLKGPLPFALVERPPRGAVPGRSPTAQT